MEGPATEAADDASGTTVTHHNDHLKWGEFVKVLSASDSMNSLSTLSRLHACRFYSLRTRQVLSLAVRFLGNSNSSLSDMIMHPIEVRPSLRLFTLLPSLRLSTSDWDSASVFPKYFKFNTNFFCNCCCTYISLFFHHLHMLQIYFQL